MSKFLTSDFGYVTPRTPTVWVFFGWLSYSVGIQVIDLLPFVIMFMLAWFQWFQRLEELPKKPHDRR